MTAVSGSDCPFSFFCQKGNDDMFHSASGDSPGHKEGLHVSGSLWVESLESLESQTPMLGSMGDFYEVN